MCDSTFVGAFVSDAGQRLAFDGCKMLGTNFTRFRALRTRFERCELADAKFAGAQAIQTNFDDCNLTGAKFDGADMRDSSFRENCLIQVSFQGTRLTGATIHRAKLKGSDITGADFDETTFEGCDFGGVKGAEAARNLEKSRPTRGSQYFENVVVSWYNTWASWERIRLFGRLPLFGMSYSAMVLIPAYLYFVAWYNADLERIQKLPHVPPEWAARHALTIPTLTWLLFVSTLFLAAASTLYQLFCPARIREFTRDVWVDQLNKPLLHYWPLSWWYLPGRLPCMALYIVGGVCALIVLTVKLWNAGSYIFAHL